TITKKISNRNYIRSNNHPFKLNTMKGKIITTICVIGLAIAGCSKHNDNNKGSTTSQATLEQNVLTDFAGNLVNPNYQDIQAKALIMNNAIIAFNANSTDANLTAIRTAWKN